MTGERALRAPVSVVCVFNDPEVRATCLDRSIEAGLADAPETEYLPVDNTQGQFASAGAALNDGARRARHEVVVFVHQDVYLHSLPALERAAADLLADPSVGLVGAVGITASDTVSGVVRDRVVMIGHPAAQDTEVDSVDEVLFAISRDRVLREPLSEHPDLAWHAYAVEYGARVRSQGLRVVTRDVPLTHNSMTTNLDRLAEAHAHVGRLHPELLPLHTTCGVVRPAAQRSHWRDALRRRRGAAVWFGESVRAVRLARATARPTTSVVLGDVRLTVDDALDVLGATGLDVVNLDGPSQGWDVDGLGRRGRDVAATSAGPDEAVRAVARVTPERALLVTGLDEPTAGLLSDALRGVPHVVGLARDTGAWVLCHPAVPATAGRLRALWPARRNAPFGLRPRATAPRRPADVPATQPA